MNKPKNYESLKQSASRLGIGVSTLRRWIREGKLTAFRPTVRVIRLDAAEVDAMMQSTAINQEKA